ncbi:MAG TPA: hypothetical protein EYP25_07155 [Anaerolineae bacterium]|nr:hypothetical protein [Anaerolineae bacterium]
MKHFFLTGLFLGLALVLVVGAVFALKGRPVASQTADPVDALAPSAPAATENWNQIAFPVDATGDIPDAQAIADNIDGAEEIRYWDASVQGFVFYIPDPVIPGGAGTNFSTQVGGSYWVKQAASTQTVFSIVGDVPPPTGQAGAIQHNLQGDAANCKWNNIMVPLDQDTISTAQDLADSIGDVYEVRGWRADSQGFAFYIPDPVIPGGAGTNFAVKIGYPYWVCMTASKTWP